MSLASGMRPRGILGSANAVEAASSGALDASFNIVAMAALFASSRQLGKTFLHRLKCGFERGIQGQCFLRVVLKVIANVDIDGDKARFRPGVYRQMRFREQYGASDALRLELMEGVTNTVQAGITRRGQA